MTQSENSPSPLAPEPPAGAGERPPERVSEPIFNLPAVVIAFIALCVGVHLVRFFLLDAEQDFALMLRGAFIPARYSGGYALDIYAFTSPLSYSLMHGGFAHLAVNMVWLAAFGSPLANRVGAPRFIAFWAITSLAAVLLHYVLHSADPIPLVGASGAISGMMGVAARFGFRVDRRRRKPAFEGDILSVREALSSRAVLTFLGIWFAVNLISGLGFLAEEAGGSIAWEAHIGGFLAGFFGVRAFDRGGSRRAG